MMSDGLLPGREKYWKNIDREREEEKEKEKEKGKVRNRSLNRSIDPLDFFFPSLFRSSSSSSPSYSSSSSKFSQHSTTIAHPTTPSTLSPHPSQAPSPSPSSTFSLAFAARTFCLRLLFTKTTSPKPANPRITAPAIDPAIIPAS